VLFITHTDASVSLKFQSVASRILVRFIKIGRRDLRLPFGRFTTRLRTHCVPNTVSANTGALLDPTLQLVSSAYYYGGIIRTSFDIGLYL
jgi:hypothetical protein